MVSFSKHGGMPSLSSISQWLSITNENNAKSFICYAKIIQLQTDETWQAPSNKALSKRTKRENSSPSHKSKTQNRIPRGQRNKLCFKALTSCKKHIRKERNFKTQ
jgi:hypothetical protein